MRTLVVADKNTVMRTHTVTATSVWSCIALVGGAIVYPFALRAFHETYVGHAGVAITGLYLVAAYAVPGLGLWVAGVLGKVSPLSARTVLARRIALVTVATPPAFTLLGVVLYLMRISGEDIVVWLGAWALIGVALLAVILVTDPSTTVPLRGEKQARIAVLLHTHGWIAAAIVVVFLAGHLINHMVALAGTDAHVAVMRVLRHIYRNPWIEPALITLFFLQIISGLILWRPRTAEPADWLTTLQTASGAYLAVYLASHINSVFVLARHFDVETDWAWATGAPTGVLADAWNIRLLPHYSLAVFFVIAHLACGLRGILRAHGVPASRSDPITWGLVAAGGAVAIAISTALVGYRIAT